MHRRKRKHRIVVARLAAGAKGESVWRNQMVQGRKTPRHPIQKSPALHLLHGHLRDQAWPATLPRRQAASAPAKLHRLPHSADSRGTVPAERRADALVEAFQGCLVVIKFSRPGRIHKLAERSALSKEQQSDLRIVEACYCIQQWLLELSSSCTTTSSRLHLVRLLWGLLAGASPC